MTSPFDATPVDLRPSGLTLLVHRTPPVADGEGDVVALQCTFSTGTVDEADDEAGAAHLLEHMLFKGTPSRGVGAATGAIEGFGGDLNAWTSHDQLTLHATVDATAWRDALDVILDMAQNALLPDVELDRERGVVLDEIAGYDDDPVSRLADEVQTHVWGTHGYARRVLGTRASVAAMTAAQLRAFRDRGLVPKRATLALVGPLDVDTVRAAVDAHSAGWSSATTPAPRAVVEITPAKGHLHRVAADGFDSRLLTLAWRLPPADHADTAALEVLAYLLGQGANPLLVAALQHDEHLAFDVWADLQPGRLGSTLDIGFIPLERMTRRALDTTLRVIEGVIQRPPGVAVARARAALLADMLFDAETSEGVADALVAWTTTHGSPAGRTTHRAALAAVTPDDVARVARRWLDRANAIVGVLDDDVTDAALRKVLAPAKPKATRPPSEGWTSRHLAPGVVLHVETCPSETIAVHLLSAGGELLSTRRHAGLANAWSRMVVAGAAGLDAARFGDALDDAAAELDAHADRDALALSLTAPLSHAREAVDRMVDAIVEPHFDAEEWDRTREELRDRVDTRLDRPDEVLDDHLRLLRWQGHPWGHPSLGTAASLDAISADDLADFHEAHFARSGKEPIHLAVSGAWTPDEAEQAFAALAELPGNRAPLAARPTPLPRWGGHQELLAGRRQAHVAWAGLGPTSGHDDALALQLGATLLDGQSGRLFDVLREQLGLAYAIGAHFASGIDGGTFVASLTTETATADRAREALDGVLRGLLQQPFSDAELDRGRRMVLGRQAVRQQRPLARAASYTRRARFGAPWTRAVLSERLAGVRAPAVAEAFARMLEDGVTTITVRGRQADA
jgi:zinc protease